MADPSGSSTVLRWPVSRAALSALIFVALGLSGGAAYLAREVARDLDALSEARSDNVLWTLTQAELELASLRTALAGAGDDPALVRRAFDILYSRIRILTASPLYTGLSADPAYAEALAAADGFLDGAVTAIDAPDPALRAALPDLQDRAAALAPALRTLSTTGLARFTELADLRRADVMRTLTRLAALTAVLLAGLIALALWLGRLAQQRAREQSDLAETTARMATIMGTSLDAVIVSDMSGRIRDFNKAAETIFGWTRAEVLGRTVGSIVVPAHLRGAHDNGMRRMAAGGDPHVVGKGRVRLEGARRDGTTFPVELALQTATQGGETIVVGYLRDISVRAAAERDLVEARDQALAGEKAKADMLAVMSHEIRTPLNGLLGSLELMEGSALNREQTRLVGNMRLSGDVLLGHVSDVLDVARLDAGHMTLHPAPTDLVRVLEDIAGGMAGPAEAAGNALTCGWAGSAPGWFSVDAGRLRQVLMNLVSNAVKFTEGGQVILEGEVLSRTDDRAEVELRVTDTGIGIPEDDIARLFEDFETRDASYSRSRGGTGLGLGIARRLVEAMGGEIGAESEIGEGSLFWLRLPLPVVAGPPEAASDDGAPGGSLDVLLVEDNAVNREVAGQMLRDAGHRVTEAVNGRDGVARAEATAFDLILMDISMPVMDGRAATRAIRTGGASRGARIVALTANVLPDDVARFREDGMDGTLAKPLTRAALRSALTETAPAVSFDGAQLDEVRDSVGAARLAVLIDRFVAEMDAAIPEGLAASDDPAGLAHRLAGSSALFGAVPLRAALLAAEDGLRAGDSPDRHRATLSQRWSEARAALLSTRA
ncbi:ATP-binding protein [Jannaschia sp.]|nr:ATP-binding protein [Jannaschia sp.]